MDSSKIGFNKSDNCVSLAFGIPKNFFAASCWTNRKMSMGRFFASVNFLTIAAVMLKGMFEKTLYFCSVRGYKRNLPRALQYLEH